MLQLFYCFNHDKRGKTQKTFKNSIFLSDLLEWLYSSILPPALYSICLVKFARGSWVLVSLSFPHHWELPLVMALSPAQPQDQPCLPHPPPSSWPRNALQQGECGDRVEFTPVCCSGISQNWAATTTFTSWPNSCSLLQLLWDHLIC